MAQQHDVVVVGGGLAGLAAAATAAREGRTVALLDAREDVGGRARSIEVDGFTLNQGPHALYRAGAGIGLLGQLGVRPSGRSPSFRHARGVRGRQLVAPFSSAAVAGMGRVDLAAALGPGAARRAAGRTTAEWIDLVARSDARDALAALVRVSTYVAEHDRLDAAAAVAQLRRAQHNVLYLDGGWQTLVDGLHDAATAAGVTIVHGKANAVASDGTAAQVTYDGGELDSASIVLAAGGPSHAGRLLGGASPTVERWASEADPVVATCLDLALRRGRDRTGPVLGLDEPTYLIPHSRSAHLAPEGGEVVHAMWYGPDGSPDRDHRASLEELMDLAHPGWRDQVVDVRVGRRLVVAHDRPRPGVAGADRPGVEVPELANVFVAGDWITAEGMLADAALSSAVRAGRLAAAVRHPGTLVG